MPKLFTHSFVITLSFVIITFRFAQASFVLPHIVVLAYVRRYLLM
jgi:hypothetical protein